MLLLMLLAAETPEQVLYGYGPLGIGVVGLAFIGYKMFNIILRDRDKATTDRDKLLEDVMTKVLPAVARNTEVLQARQDIDKELLGVIKDSTEQLKQNSRVFEEVSYMLKHGQGTNRVGGP